MGGWTLALAMLVITLLAEGAEGRRARGSHSHSPPSPQGRSEVEESFPLDFTPVQGNMEAVMRQVQNLAKSLYHCSGRKLDQEMKLRFLDNSTVTCNDGSPAGWVTFLQTGALCSAAAVCILSHIPSFSSIHPLILTRVGVVLEPIPALRGQKT